MLSRVALVVALCAWAGTARAQAAGTAAGKGSLARGEETVAFSPRFAFAYTEGTGANKSTWLVLSEKDPPLKAWSAVKDRAEARRLWCEKEKTPFAALKLDAEMKVDLYFTCPANGGLNTEMLSTTTGLDNVAPKFDAKGGPRLRGTLKTGTGSCPAPGGGATYCAQTGDYSFDAPLVR